jgi:rhodanese-related sulfurtransferase
MKMVTKQKWIFLFTALLPVVFCGLAIATEEGYRIINTHDLKKLLDTPNQHFTLVDARTPTEYQEVHIKGAINVPANDFAEKSHLLPADKASLVIFYCNGIKCGKSKKAAKKALEQGYINVTVYAEGMPIWEEKGMPIYAGPDYEKRIETTKIPPEELNKMIEAKGNDFTIVDVRDAEEYKAGHIPGAINIPAETFASESHVLDKEKKIVVYCNSGGRSYNAYRKLMKLGYKNISQSIFSDWKEKGLVVEKIN